MALLEYEVRKRIEDKLRRYAELKKTAREEREAALHAEDYTIRARGTKRGSVTEGKAVKLAGLEMTEAARWLYVAEGTRKRYEGTEGGRLMKLHFDRGYGQVKTSRKMNVSEETFYRMKREIIEYAALLAAERGLIKL